MFTRILTVFISTLFYSFTPSGFAENSIAEQCSYKDSKESIRVGLARDANTQNPLYCEYHFWEKEPINESVEYRDLAHNLIVKKTLDYSNGKLSPSAIQKDLRHGEIRVARKQVSNNGTQQESVYMEYQAPRKTKLKNATVELTSKGSAKSSSLVIDGGFDYAMLENWGALYAGEAVKFDFASPVHRKVFNLSIKRSKQEICGQRKLADTEVCYLMTPSNTVLSWFVKPVELIYTTSPNRLKVFFGDVNITDKKGKTHKAVIEYIYNSYVKAD